MPGNETSLNGPNLTKELIRTLQSHRLTVQFDSRTSLLEVQAVPEVSRHTEPWIIVLSHPAVQGAVDTLRAGARSGQAGQSRKATIADIAARIEEDLRVYRPSHGPFLLDEIGQLCPDRPAEDPFHDESDGSSW